VVAAIDARMGEVYAASFQLRDGEAIALTPEAVLPPDRFQPLDAAGDWHGVGTGFAAAEGALVRAFGAGLASVDAAALPHAGDVARLAARAFARGEAVAPERVEPAYLRDNVALTLEQQRKARG
jgi:tRNA threonylcarbamoyladenosine biosynthesis protein TsaB